MHYEFFSYGRIDNISLKIKEISLITPYYVKGQLDSVWDLLFCVSKGDGIYMKGSLLFDIHKKILFEAEGILISGQNYQYEEYDKRVLLNYAIGFMKSETERMKNIKKEADIQRK